IKGPSESGSSSTPHVRITDEGVFTHEGEVCTKNNCLIQGQINLPTTSIGGNGGLEKTINAAKSGYTPI
ncbi:hypothetical protein, partial [Mordavella massiliensis]|uniref:hypothetical protein n=1 Tax=Mordavella massiliensis TaxID=1871024 RepID=UPI00195974AA